MGGGGGRDLAQPKIIDVVPPMRHYPTEVSRGRKFTGAHFSRKYSYVHYFKKRSPKVRGRNRCLFARCISCATGPSLATRYATASST